MTIPNLAVLKVVQAINLPQDVTAVNIYYFDADFTTPQAVQDVLDTLELWVEALYDTIVSQLSDLVSLGEMTLYSWNSAVLQWDNEGTAAPTKVGTETTPMLPHGVAALVRAYTVASRTIGRKYIPGFGDVEQADGAWVAGALTALAAFGNAWDDIATVSAGNALQPAVWSTKHFGTRRLTGVEVVLANAAYQRRRRPGVGS